MAQKNGASKSRKMKKKILGLAVLQLFLMLGSCSGPESEPAKELTPEGIKVDFIAQYNVADFIISSDNTIYSMGQRHDDKGYSYNSLRSVTAEGKETILKDFDLGTNNYGRLTFSKTGDVLLISKGNESPDQDKILRFDNNFSELNSFYTMKPISSPYASKINLLTICNNNDNTYFAFDYNNKNIKRILPELNTDVFVAGSGKHDIVDGAGLEVSFGDVTRIISLNNVLYFIDELYGQGTGTYKKSSIRKLEYVNNVWTVTTLISTSGERYTDIAFDSKNDLYVSIREKGIYKVNLIDKSMSIFMDKEEFRIWTKNPKDDSTVQDFINFKFVDGFKFKNNDLYISQSNLIKISDYQTNLLGSSK